MAPPGIDLHVIPVRDPHIVTLTVEESIGSCERRLAFVVFLESPAGFGRWLGAGSSGRDSLRVDIATVPNPVTVSYSRTTGLLTVGTFNLDTSKANVVFLSVGPNSMIARYQQAMGLTFERDGHPPPSTGMAFLDAQPEIALEVRKLLQRGPELQRLVERRGGRRIGRRLGRVPAIAISLGRRASQEVMSSGVPSRLSGPADETSAQGPSQFPGQWKMRSFPQGSLALLLSRYLCRYELVDAARTAARVVHHVLSGRVAHRLHPEPGRRHPRRSVGGAGRKRESNPSRAPGQRNPGEHAGCQEQPLREGPERLGPVIVHAVSIVQPAVHGAEVESFGLIEHPYARWIRQAPAHVPVWRGSDEKVRGFVPDR